MQALSRFTAIEPYSEGVPIGRPSTRERTHFGKRVFALREAAGLTQAEVAHQLDISQRAYAAWERDPVAIQPERIKNLAVILGTTVSELLDAPKTQRTSATGRVGRTFEAISKLPRRRQAKILDVVDALLAQQNGSS